ncbi:helix-turn-helix DNA binding domain protein [Mycobacterium phage Shida]|nr:helix-turn-helix DNA binding domain protein [Mycobacterium phage Shida]WNO28636.1 helix-turn-helix DNA binding domain protein [Mycobacterium phage MadKillah]
MVMNMVGIKSEPGPTAVAVAAAVKWHRERIGWGYARLSRELTKVGRDIPPLGLGRIESGTRRVDVDDLTALAFVFEVSPISLLMPQVSDGREPAALTGPPPLPGEHVWLWLNGSYPLTGSVLSFYNHALPPWERDSLEETLGAVRKKEALS